MKKLTVVTICLTALIGLAVAQVDDGAVRAIWGGGAASASQYQANESDLSQASYVLAGQEREARVLLNWSNGLLRFTGVAYSDDLLDEEGLKMEARDYAYVKAREFIDGVIVGREAKYEQSELRMATDEGQSDKRGKKTTQRHSVSAPAELIRTGPIVNETFEHVAHPSKMGAKVARSEVVIALLLYNVEHPEQSIVGKMLPSLQASLTEMEIAPVEAPTTAVVEQARQADPQLDKYTGLIIDTRGHRMRPVASPEVYIQEQEDRLLYGALQVDPDYVSKFGIAGWCKNESQATGMERVGEMPLRVQAAGTLGSSSGAVLLAPEDAARIMAADTFHPFLRECRVAFVVD